MQPAKVTILKWVKFISSVKALWSGTRLSGYAENGPYHCEDCVHLNGRLEGKSHIYRDADGKGRCDHLIVRIDSKVKKDAEGRSIVNIEKGCCEFVDERGLKD